jgi:hypothetical protein
MSNLELLLEERSGCVMFAGESRKKVPDVQSPRGPFNRSLEGCPPDRGHTP